MAYDDRIDDKLDQIASAVDKLDHTLAEYNDADGGIKQFFEEKKALFEIRSILRKADDIQQIQNDQIEAELAAAHIDETGSLGIGEDLSPTDLTTCGEDQLLDKIAERLTTLDDTLQKAGGDQPSPHEVIRQREALYDIKKALKRTGHYSGYIPGELIEQQGYESIQ